MNALLHAILDAVNDPVWVVRRDRSVAASNAAYRTVAAKAESFDALWRELAGRVFAGRNVSADLRTVVDNVERSYAIVAVAADGHAVFTARDVTDVSRTKREDQLELAVTRIFAGEQPVETALQQVLEFICESDDWDCAVVWLLDANETRLTARAVWSRLGIDAEKFRERIHELHFTETGYVRADAAARAGLHGAAAVPLHDGERFVGRAGDSHARHSSDQRAAPPRPDPRRRVPRTS